MQGLTIQRTARILYEKGLRDIYVLSDGPAFTLHTPQIIGVDWLNLCRGLSEFCPMIKANLLEVLPDPAR
jgi:hypothetical protein